MSDSDTNDVITDEQAQALLERALAHLQREEALETEAVLTQILAARSDDPDALQLLGLLRRMQGRGEEAEQLYRKSLAVKPDQPQVHHNLGNLLRVTGRSAEAAEAQREAIRLKPNFAIAHLNLGLALSDLDDLAGAEKSLRRALQIQPNFLPIKQSLGAVLNDRGRPKEAEAVLRQALVANSPHPRQVAALEHNLGISMARQYRYGEALQLFDSAQAKVPEMPFVDYNRANALQGVGQLDAAVEYYHRAIARNPLDTMAHHDLNGLLFRRGDDDRFLRSYDDALALYPSAGGLALAKANFLFTHRDYDKARVEFERAAGIMPDQGKPHDGLGMIHARNGDFDAAIREHEIAIGKEPSNTELLRNFAETMLRAGDARKSLEAAERCLALDPNDQGAIAFSGTALGLLNDSREEILNDYEQFVQVFDIEPPPGYGDVESFNRDLNSFLDTIHRDKREAVDQSIRGGTQTMGDLFNRNLDLVEQLRRRIDEAVTTYISRMNERADHPLLGRRRASFGYSGSWSSRLHDCGFHDNHFHPKGWISSAYYVALPGAVDDVDEKQGWLKFGEPFFDTKLKNPIRRVVQPRLGRLVLFPSYMWHGTVPFRADNARTSVAFDVVPK